MQERIAEMLRQCEKLLRDCDEDMGTAAKRKRRNAVNAACNALHRATKA